MGLGWAFSPCRKSVVISTTGDGYKILSINGKHTREHRHVMEKFIGRKLKPFENVHHLDGNRLNNNIENLELWTERQPTGSRVIDLIKFIHNNYHEEYLSYSKSFND